MKKQLLFELLIYILEMVVSIYFKKVRFFPLFGYLYMLHVARQYHYNKEKYLFCFLSGLLYDLFVTTTPFMNSFLFPFLYFTIQKFDAYLLKNKCTFFILVILEIFFYRTFTYLLLLIIQYQTFSLSLYFDSILYSLLPNFLFILLYQLLLFRRKKQPYRIVRKRMFS